MISVIIPVYANDATYIIMQKQIFLFEKTEVYIYIYLNRDPIYMSEEYDWRNNMAPFRNQLIEKIHELR